MHTLSRCENITPSQNRARGFHYYDVIQQTRLTYFFFSRENNSATCCAKADVRMRDWNSHVILGLQKKSMLRIFHASKSTRS